MSAMAAEPPPRLDSVLSFGNAPMPGDDRPAEEEVHTLDFSDAGSDDDDAGFEFEFAFAPPIGGSPGSAAAPDLAPADDLFAHGRLVPAYPVFDRHLLLDDRDEATTPAASAAPQGPSTSTAPPSPDNYCAWAPRSAPGSPAREFPKSASTGESSSRRFRGLHGLFSGAGAGRSHSDGKEKFLFLQPAAAAPSKMSGSKAEATAAKPSSSPAQQKQSKRKGGKAAAAGAVTEMDMATAHKLFYGKPGAGALAGDRKHQPQQSFLPYRPGIVGFFTAAHALGGRSHHPY